MCKRRMRDVIGGKREAWRRPVEGSIMMKKASWQTIFPPAFGTPAYFNSAATTQLELFSSIVRHLILCFWEGGGGGDHFKYTIMFSYRKAFDFLWDVTQNDTTLAHQAFITLRLSGCNCGFGDGFLMRRRAALTGIKGVIIDALLSETLRRSEDLSRTLTSATLTRDQTRLNAFILPSRDNGWMLFEILIFIFS